MMKVSFAEIDEAYLRNQVKHGYYSSVSEAIRDAVRKQRENDQTRLLDALSEGEKAVQEGRFQTLTREMFDDITEKGIKAAESGDIVTNPDVTG